jgi:hypothetical protein
MYTLGDLLEVEWHDAADEADGWQDIEDLIKDPPVHLVRTVGYYIKSTSDHLYLTPTIKDEQYAVLSIIPAGCIVEIQTLERMKIITKVNIGEV